MSETPDTLVEDIGLDEVPFSSGDEGNPDLVNVDGLDFEIIDDGVTAMPDIETLAGQANVDNDVDKVDGVVDGGASQPDDGLADDDPSNPDHGSDPGPSNHLEAQLETQRRLATQAQYEAAQARADRDYQVAVAERTIGPPQKSSTG